MSKMTTEILLFIFTTITLYQEVTSLNPNFCEYSEEIFEYVPKTITIQQRKERKEKGGVLKLLNPRNLFAKNDYENVTKTELVAEKRKRVYTTCCRGFVKLGENCVSASSSSAPSAAPAPTSTTVSSSVEMPRVTATPVVSVQSTATAAAPQESASPTQPAVTVTTVMSAEPPPNTGTLQESATNVESTLPVSNPVPAEQPSPTPAQTEPFPTEAATIAGATTAEAQFAVREAEEVAVTTVVRPTSQNESPASSDVVNAENAEPETLPLPETAVPGDRLTDSSPTTKTESVIEQVMSTSMAATADLTLPIVKQQSDGATIPISEASIGTSSGAEEIKSTNDEVVGTAGQEVGSVDGEPSETPTTEMADDAEAVKSAGDGVAGTAEIEMDLVDGKPSEVPKVETSDAELVKFVNNEVPETAEAGTGSVDGESPPSEMAAESRISTIVFEFVTRDTVGFTPSLSVNNDDAWRPHTLQ